MLIHESRGADFISNGSDMTGMEEESRKERLPKEKAPVCFFPGRMVKNYATVIVMMECYS